MAVTKVATQGEPPTRNVGGQRTASGAARFPLLARARQLQALVKPHSHGRPSSKAVWVPHPRSERPGHVFGPNLEPLPCSVIRCAMRSMSCLVLI